MKIIKLDQRTSEWGDWRKLGIGASETAQVLNKSPFGSSQNLWELKTDRRPAIKMNPAMLKGQQDEPAALEAYEELTGQVMSPQCAEHDTYSFIRASYDGITSDGKKAVEIKCPGVKTHQMAIDGNIPEYYLIQMHQQMLVADIQEIDFFSYYKEWPDVTKRGILITVQRSEILINEIIAACTEFWDHVQNDVPMYVEGWDHAAAYWLAIQEEISGLGELEANAKEALLLLANGQNMQGAGVSLTYSTRTGGIDYKAACADKGISDDDLEKFRKADSSSVTVRKLKHSPIIDDEKPALPASSILTKVDVTTQEEAAWNW